ncbi:hypothetical protein BKK52_11215 [Rodentibacter trehalosifermentans]|uniref:DUF2570 domain-containing protein n=1 Tax=Rodentibacter trehalosifermentans TaxID=1908263 RepID=A0A1V3IWC9_9PAST|nr:hypothetical protein BKK52_11215 [Rodentibacter trehalosifermentans]
MFVLVAFIALTAILGLGGWVWHQSNVIDELKADNQAQAQTIANQSAVISRLKFEAEENQRLTLELSKAESEARSKSDEVIRTIPKQIKESEAYNSNAPRSIVEFLRQE